MYTHLDFLCSQ